MNFQIKVLSDRLNMRFSQLIQKIPFAVCFSELDQLPAPDLGGNDVLPEMFLTTFKKTSEILNTRSEIPPDTLIDPDGRVVAFSRRFEQK